MTQVERLAEFATRASYEGLSEESRLALKARTLDALGYKGRVVALRVMRVYENPTESDSERLLVDRIWPRGISKDKARLSDWRKGLAPSNDLRKWFGHDPDRWEGFKERYRAELEEAGKMEEVREISDMAEDGNVTLIFGAKNTEHNNARALASFIREP